MVAPGSCLVVLCHSQAILNLVQIKFLLWQYLLGSDIFQEGKKVINCGFLYVQYACEHYFGTIYRKNIFITFNWMGEEHRYRSIILNKGVKRIIYMHFEKVC